MANQAKLIFRSGVQIGDKKDISGTLLRIGRDPANDFVVDEIEVSRNHAKITCNEGIYKIEDLNSTNGTLLNGRRISNSEKLKDGDLISLGEANIFEFSITKEIDKVLEPSSVTEPKFDAKGHNDLLSKREIESDFETIGIADAPNEKKTNFFNGLSKLPTWAVVILIALGFIILFCIIPLFFIEISNQWCNLFSGFFNAISPGICS